MRTTHTELIRARWLIVFCLSLVQPACVLATDAENGVLLDKSDVVDRMNEMPQADSTKPKMFLQEYEHEMSMLAVVLCLLMFGTGIGFFVFERYDRWYQRYHKNIQAVAPYQNKLLPRSSRCQTEQQCKVRLARLLRLLAPDYKTLTPASLDAILMDHVPGFNKHRRALVDLFAYGYVQRISQEPRDSKAAMFAVPRIAERTGLQEELAKWAFESWLVALKGPKRQRSIPTPQTLLRRNHSTQAVTA